MRSDLDREAPSLDAVQQARSWLAAQQGGADELPAEVEREAPVEVERAATGADADSDSEADPESVARGIALRLLTARARTRDELRQALARRSVPDDVTTRVLDRFTEVGLLDDAGFAQQWVTSRQSRRHLSRTRLRQELQRKGVDSNDIEAALAGVGVAQELEAARALGRKKLATLSGVDATTRYRRLAGVLTRRGFSTGTVSTVLSELLGR